MTGALDVYFEYQTIDGQGERYPVFNKTIRIYFTGAITDGEIRKKIDDECRHLIRSESIKVSIAAL